MGRKRKGGASTDRHRAKNVVRFGDEVYAPMKALAEEGDRAIAREFRLAVVAWLKRKGRWPTPGPPA